jgi:uncharacterized membrane protein YdbT with pleckstrin-like domain
MSEHEAPKGYLRKVLATGEQVLLIQRQHWLAAAGLIAAAVVNVVSICVIVTLLLMKLGQGRGWIAYGYGLAVIALLHLWWRLLAWRLRQFVVTNRRVIQISGVFTKDVIDSALDKVTDIRSEQNLLGRMFNYGDVEVLTASETGKNQFFMIADPLGFKRAMLDAQQLLFHPGMGQA